jgi:hypothetical protein
MFWLILIELCFAAWVCWSIYRLNSLFQGLAVHCARAIAELEARQLYLELHQGWQKEKPVVPGGTAGHNSNSVSVSAGPHPGRSRLS